MEEPVKGEVPCRMDRTAQTEVRPNTAPANARETPPADRAWRYENEHGACTRIHDRSTDSPVDIIACNQHIASEPRCLDYRGYAETARSADFRLLQPQMLNGIGTSPGTRSIET